MRQKFSLINSKCVCEREIKRSSGMWSDCEMRFGAHSLQNGTGKVRLFQGTFSDEQQHTLLHCDQQVLIFSISPTRFPDATCIIRVVESSPSSTPSSISSCIPLRIFRCLPPLASRLSPHFSSSPLISLTLKVMCVKFKFLDH